MKLITREEMVNFNYRELVDYQMFMYGLKLKLEKYNSFNDYLLSNNLFVQEELLDEIIDIKRKKIEKALLTY